MIQVAATGDISEVETKRLDKGTVTNFTFMAEGIRFRGSAWGDVGKDVRDGKAFVAGKLAGREYQNAENQTRRSLDLTASTIESFAPALAGRSSSDDGGIDF